jgi:regulator of sigma E protease
LSAFVLMLVVLLAFGAPSKITKVNEPRAGKPAAIAGMMAGDVLVEANGQAVSLDAPISEVIRAGQGAPVTIKVLRKGQPMTFVVTPEKIAAGTYQIGIEIGSVDERTAVSVQTALHDAVMYPYYASVLVLKNLSELVRGHVHLRDLSGPVGITKEMAKAAQRGGLEFLDFVALLSVYLGLFNLLPLPALDGGRAVFLVVESVRRRSVNPRIEAAVHTVGFALLLGVLLLVTFKDLFLKG